MSHKSGRVMNFEEARRVLTHYGELEKTWAPTADQVSLYGLKPGFFLQFKFYNAGRTAQMVSLILRSNALLTTVDHFVQKIREETDFQLDQAANLSDSPVRSPVNRFSPNERRSQEYLKEYSHDRVSIFVGNFPQSWTEDDLRSFFAPYGAIVSVSLKKLPSTRISRYSFSKFLSLTNPSVVGETYSHGTVEFEDAITPLRAIQGKASVVTFALNLTC
jgi:hypothetical protein